MASWSSRLLALLFAAAAVAGCGGADPQPGALPRFSDIDELIAAVSAQQRVDRTARFSLRGELIGAENARLRFTGTGELRISDDDVELSFTQVVTQPGADPQETGFVVLPDAVYLRMPAGDGDERPWVRVDPDDDDPDAQQLIALADQVTERADLTVTLSRYADAPRSPTPPTTSSEATPRCATRSSPTSRGPRRPRRTPPSRPSFSSRCGPG